MSRHVIRCKRDLNEGKLYPAVTVLPPAKLIKLSTSCSCDFPSMSFVDVDDRGVADADVEDVN